MQDTCSGSSILANARLWGVQILHVDGILHCGVQGAAGNEAFGDRWSRRDGRKVEQKEEIASKSPGVMPSWSG